MNKSVRPFMFTISNNSLYIKCNMLSKTLKWELGFVHYIAKFTILRFIKSRSSIMLFQKCTEINDGIKFSLLDIIFLRYLFHLLFEFWPKFSVSHQLFYGTNFVIYRTETIYYYVILNIHTYYIQCKFQNSTPCV